MAETVSRIWRRKGLVLATIMVLTAIAAATALSLTPKYSAEAKLRIGLVDAQVAEMSSGLAGMGADAAMIQSEQYVLSSRELVGRVSDRLALERVAEFNARLREPGPLAWLNPKPLLQRIKRAVTGEPAAATAPNAGPNTLRPGTGPAQPPDWERERAINALLARLDIEPLGRSHVLSIKARSADPYLAARIANTLGEIYIETSLIRRTETIGATNKWLSRHIERLRANLDAAERAVETYRRDHALYSNRSSTITSQQLTELNTLVIASQARLAEANTRLQQARRTMQAANAGSAMPEVLRSPLIQALKQQQSSVERRAAELSTKYGAKHPNIRNVEAEKRDIARKIRGEIDNIVAALRSEAAAAKAGYDALRANLEQTKSAMGDSKAVSIELRALEREADANKALFQQFLQRVKETEAQRDMEAASARLVSRAAIPGAPSSPPVNLLIALGVIGGAMCGVLLALVVERLDRTFRTDDEVEIQTALPTLAVVPKVSRRLLRNGHVLTHPTSEFSESIRKLSMALRLDQKKEGATVVMMASSVANEGKSGICLGLAKLCAASGANVMVLDCDWRLPQLHAMVNQPNRLGIGELLTGNTRPEDVVYRDRSGAHMIFAGKLRSRHAHLLCSDRMKGLLQSLSRHYDLVLIDTPPVLVGAEVLHLSRLVNMAIYVVRWGQTRRETALKGLRQLAAMDAPLVGTVLSQVNSGRYRRYVGYAAAYRYRWSGVRREV